MNITDKVIIELSKQLKAMSAGSSPANDSVVDRLFDIMDKSLKKQKVDRKALENGAVYIVGTTGAGKSTLLNYLAGKNLKVINDEGTIKLVLENPADGVSAIGSGDGQSETVYPQTYLDSENHIAYIDNPGDQDSRGIAQQILNSYFKHNISKACPKVQILIVTSFSAMAADNGTDFVDYLQKFAKSLEDFELISSHISLVFTRVSSITTVDNVLSKLEKMLENQSTNLGQSKKILENILKQKKIGLFIEPSNDQIGKRYESPEQEKVGRKGILDMLKSGTYAPVPKDGLFKVTVSDTDTIHKILANSIRDQDSLSTLIVSSIKSTLVQKVAGLEDVGTFLELDEDPLIKSGAAKNTDLKKFFQEKLNMDISEDYSFGKLEFFHRLLGEKEFLLNFGSVNKQFNDLKIKELFNSEPTLDKSDDTKVVLRGFNVKTSAFKDKVLELQGDGITQASIQAINAINFDQDLNFSDFSKLENAKLSIISPIWNLGKETKLNLDGKDGEKYAESKPQDGASKEKAGQKQNGDNGENGTDGLPGNNGQNGRSFLGIGTKFVSASKKLIITSNGGNGSNGQSGSNGGNGGDGGDYESPPSKPLLDYDESQLNGVVSQEYLGGNGGTGGDAGNGAQGGYEGQAGVLEILINSNNCIEETAKNGKRGKNGDPGQPGNGGKNGAFEIRNVFGGGVTFQFMKSNQEGAEGNSATSLVKAKDPSKQSDVPYSEIIDYEKFLTSYFGNKDISRDIALEALKNFIKGPKPEILDTSVKLGLKGLIDEVQVLNGLYSAFLNEEGWKLSAKELISLYERSLAKITAFGQTLFMPQNKVDSQALLCLYTAVVMALNSLKPAYTVVNFDYLEYFTQNKILDYNQIVQREKVAASKKEYDQKIAQEIESANKCISSLNDDVDQLNKMLDKQINGLKEDMKKTEEKKEEYAKQMETASTLKIVSNVMKTIASVVSYLGPEGAAAGAVVSAGAAMVDFATPDGKPLSLKDLNPTTFLQLQDKGDKLIDTKKFIDILKNVYDEDQKITISQEKEKLARMNPKKVTAGDYEEQKAHVEKLEEEAPTKSENYAKKLVQDAAKDPKKFILDNCKELDKRKEDATKNLTEEQKIGFNTLELERKKFQMTKYVTYISNAVQTASNIATAVQDCLAAQKQAEAAVQDLDNFKQIEESIQSFMDQSIQGIEKSMQGFANSLAQADSHAQIDYIRYGFKEQMQSVTDYFQSTLANYEYSDGDVSKANLFNVLNKFDRLGDTLADIQQRIADANDKKDLANLITAVGEPSSDISEAYPNFLELSKSMQSHLLAKEGNDILYSIKQSQFPIAPYYSYDYYSKSLDLKKTDVNTVLAGIKAAYERHELSKYAFTQYEKYIKPHAKFVSDDPSSKGPFSTWQGADEPVKLSALLNGEEIIITSDIRYAPKGADAIKFREVNLKLKLTPKGSDKVHPLDKEFQKELVQFNVELTSSGVYAYRYDDKYYNIPSTPIYLSYAYAGGNSNTYYEKIAKGDPIFSPYTTWTVKLTPVSKATAPDALYRKFGANVADLELSLVGEAQYIDMESYDGKAREDIIVNECYNDFVLDRFEVAVL